MSFLSWRNLYNFLRSISSLKKSQNPYKSYSGGVNWQYILQFNIISRWICSDQILVIDENRAFLTNFWSNDENLVNRLIFGSWLEHLIDSIWAFTAWHYTQEAWQILLCRGDQNSAKILKFWSLTKIWSEQIHRLVVYFQIVIILFFVSQCLAVRRVLFERKRSINYSSRHELQSLSNMKDEQ